MNDKELSTAQCREYGEKFLGLGWWVDGLEFFQKGNYEPGLETIKALALEAGDAYLLGRLGRHSPEVWLTAGEQAVKQGKLRFAARAFKQAGEKEKAENLLRQLQENSAPAQS